MPFCFGALTAAVSIAKAYYVFITGSFSKPVKSSPATAV